MWHSGWAIHGGRKRTKLEIQPGNEAPVYMPVGPSAPGSLAPDLRETPQRLACLMRRTGTPTCSIWNHIFLLTRMKTQGQEDNFAFLVSRTRRGASNTSLPFGSTYLCEGSLPAMTTLKINHWNKLNPRITVIEDVKLIFLNIMKHSQCCIATFCKHSNVLLLLSRVKCFYYYLLYIILL